VPFRPKGVIVAVRVSFRPAGTQVRLFGLDVFSAISLVAEEKILEAQRQGAFDGLPGAGRPMLPDDSLNLPPDQRMAYTILKNSGYLALDASVTDVPASPELPPAMEEGRTRARLLRLALALSRRKIFKGEAAADLALDLGLSRVMEDSPYLGKALRKF